MTVCFSFAPITTHLLHVIKNVISVYQEPVLKEGYLVKSPDVSKHLHVFKVCQLLQFL